MTQSAGRRGRGAGAVFSPGNGVKASSRSCAAPSTRTFHGPSRSPSPGATTAHRRGERPWAVTRFTAVADPTSRAPVRRMISGASSRCDEQRSPAGFEQIAVHAEIGDADAARHPHAAGIGDDPLPPAVEPGDSSTVQIRTARRFFHMPPAQGKTPGTATKGGACASGKSKPAVILNAAPGGFATGAE